MDRQNSFKQRKIFFFLDRTLEFYLLLILY